MKNKKWTIVTIVLLLLGGVATIFGISDRWVPRPEYNTHVRTSEKFQQRVYNQLDNIEQLLRN